MDKCDEDQAKIFEESEYIWILHKFAELKSAYGQGTSLKSPVFPEKDNKYKWQLSIFPNGTKPVKDRVGVFLVQPQDSPVFAKFTLSIRDSNDEVVFERKLRHVFIKDESDWGFQSAILPEQLKTSFSDDIIKIHVVVLAEVFTVQPFHKVAIQPNSPQKEVLRHLGSMLKTGEFSDFAMKFDDSSEIKVHRNILAARSPVFSAMFMHDTTENKLGYVDITDNDKDTMLLLLNFIYTGEISDLSMDEAENLLAAADKYQILDLKQICANSLTKNLRISNVLDILLLAEYHHVPELKNSAFGYILKHSWKFSDPAMFEEIVNKSPNLLAEIVAKLAKMFEEKTDNKLA